MTPPTEITEESTSSDSTKLADIVDGIRHLIPDDLSDEFDNANPDNVGFIFEEICDFLNDIAPDDLIFGTSEGDGACYGFWKIEQE